MKLHHLGLGVRLLAGALVAGGVVLACSSDDSTGGTNTPGQDAGPGADGATADSATPADAAPAVDAADAAVLPTSIPAGKYAITTWTCGPAGGSPKDIKAFAATIGIQGVNQTFSGMTGIIDTLHGGDCVRTVPMSSITYPSPGKVSVVAGGARTCAGTCAPSACTPGTEADVAASYSFTTSGTSLTFTRPLDAAFFNDLSLQKVAGCMAGDTETVTLTKQ